MPAKYNRAFLTLPKAATSIFISGCGKAILSAQEGISGCFYNLAKSFLSVYALVYFMNIVTVYTLNSQLLML